MNKIAPDPKAVIEALESRILRLEDALKALLDYRSKALLDYRSVEGFYPYRLKQEQKRVEEIIQNFREDTFKKRKEE